MDFVSLHKGEHMKEEYLTYFDEKTPEVRNKLEYLKLLERQYPTIAAASTEIINLKAILSLPKGTEHFLSDVHGEYETFLHVLKNASGVIKTKIDDLFKTTMLESERKSLATLVYYPQEKLQRILKQEQDLDSWYRVTLYRLIELARYSGSKYTRSKVRKALPKDFAYILEELLHEQEHEHDKQKYYDRILSTIIDIGRANEFIIALCELIQRLCIDHLHILGDIYDRGPRPDIILDRLMTYHSVDIQWGNHDILWMGAAAGSDACICKALRNSLRYGNLQFVEEAYGINLLPLAMFAMDVYGDDPCTLFQPKLGSESTMREKERQLLAQMQKAITIIQLKCEAAIIQRHPEYEMEHQLLLHLMDHEFKTVTIAGEVHAMKDSYFPTIDPQDPYRLSDEESELLAKLRVSFIKSEKLQRHTDFLFSKGKIYLRYNNNLLFHGCIPLSDVNTFKTMRLEGEVLYGRKLLKKFEAMARAGYYGESEEERQNGRDMMWYLWCGPTSSLYGKEKMATFERLFLADKKTHKEAYNAYYSNRENEAMCKMILQEFQLTSEDSIIINGHIPVKGKDGESPVKGHGRMIVIDGGFSKAYQSQTGIAGYTLIYNSHGLQLISHNHFESMQHAIENELDINSTKTIITAKRERMLVEDTDVGVVLRNQIDDLSLLLVAYRKGIMKENYQK